MTLQIYFRDDGGPGDDRPDLTLEVDEVHVGEKGDLTYRPVGRLSPSVFVDSVDFYSFTVRA